MTSTSSDMTELSEDFVQEAYRVTREAAHTAGKSHVQTIRAMFYKNGIVATDDEVFKLLRRLRPVFSAPYGYDDSGVKP